MLKRGIDAKFSIKGASDTAALNVVTRTDLTFTTSLTEIEVKNAASNEVRYIPGMETTEFTVQVQAGTDPEDAAGFNAFTKLKGFYDNKEVFTATFTPPEGGSKTKDMIITKWVDQNPIDGLSVADITFRRAAGAAGESFSAGAGSASGSGSGSGE